MRADGELLVCEPANGAADGAALLPVLSMLILEPTHRSRPPPTRWRCAFDERKRSRLRRRRSPPARKPASSSNAATILRGGDKLAAEDGARRRSRRRAGKADRGRRRQPAALRPRRLPPRQPPCAGADRPTEKAASCASRPTTCWAKWCAAWAARSAKSKRRSSPKPAPTARTAATTSWRRRADADLHNPGHGPHRSVPKIHAVQAALNATCTRPPAATRQPGPAGRRLHLFAGAGMGGRSRRGPRRSERRALDRRPAATWHRPLRGAAAGRA